MLSSRSLATIALAAITAPVAISLTGQEKAQKDTSKDKDFSVTVQGPDTDAGLIVSARATAKEVGLPVYPGSMPHKDQDRDNDSPAAKIGLWGSSFGFKLVVLKMESKDAPRKVADYYQRALAKYGTVLDCTTTRPQQAKDENSAKLTCGDDKPETGGMLFKASLISLLCGNVHHVHDRHACPVGSILANALILTSVWPSPAFPNDADLVHRVCHCSFDVPVSLSCNRGKRVFSIPIRVR